MKVLTPSRAKLGAFLWLAFITLLFLLPGTALPKASWTDGIYFDKWVHFIFFAVLLFLWRFFSKSNDSSISMVLFLGAFIYGTIIELVQHYYVVFRSFDEGDLAADSVGAIAGLLLWHWYKKNRPL